MRTPNLAITLHSDDAESSIPAPAPSPVSSPRSPHTPLPQSPMNPSFAEGYDLHPNHRSPMTAMPAPSPKTKAKSFFSNPMASRSATKLPKSESPSRQAAGSPPRGPIGQVYNMNRAMGSSPELGITGTESSSTITDDRTINPASAVDYSFGISNAPKKKASKHKFNILGRKTSLKDEDNLLVDGKNSTSQKFKSSKAVDKTKQHREMLAERGPRGSGLRNRSGDRQGHQDEYQVPSSTNGQHASLHQNIRNTGNRAADGFGRAAKGLLGKLSTRTGPGERNADRSSRNVARDEADAQRAAITKSYKVINLPLEEQTRKTRICKRLEDCKDKTEFWLPAVAYRCIDYLNDKGMTHEGLYRVPGSEREIRNWIWRFDNELDIDLLAENDLYDINTISSMFKAWLRDLPDEVFPKSLQYKISSSVGNLSEQQGAPEILKTELSNLPPFNYYLLFAVTAHITMLLNASKENKMTFHNLCVCFMPALKMEMPCFTWLILDWKNCWQGCATERDYMEREYAFLDGGREAESSAGGGNGNSSGAGETAAGRLRPMQHFDRYDRYGSKQGGSGTTDDPDSFSQQVESALKASGSAAAGSSNANASKNGGGDRRRARSPSTSPDLRPSTSPVGMQPHRDREQQFAAAAEASRARSAKGRPAPLEGLGVSGAASSAGASGREQQQPPQHNRQQRQQQQQQSSRERSGSEPAAALLDWASQQQQLEQHGERAFETPGRKAGLQHDGAGGGRLVEPPELSPVKPLSPFGNLGGL